jgi:hypothetical protein
MVENMTSQIFLGDEFASCFKKIFSKKYENREKYVDFFGGHVS